MNARGAALYTFTLCPWFVSDELGVVAFRVATGSAYSNLATLILQNGIRLRTVNRG